MAVQSDTVVAKGEYARLRGCSAAYVSKLIREGRLTAPALRPDGRIDRVLADAQIDGGRQRVQAELPVMVPTTDAEESDSLTEARKAVLREQQRRLERENEVAEGRLVDRVRVEEEQETAARQTRDAMLRVPHLVADRLARETDPARVKIILREAIERALVDAVHQQDEAATEDGEDAGVRTGSGS